MRPSRDSILIGELNLRAGIEIFIKVNKKRYLN